DYYRDLSGRYQEQFAAIEGQALDGASAQKLLDLVQQQIGPPGNALAGIKDQYQLMAAARYWLNLIEKAEKDQRDDRSVQIRAREIKERMLAMIEKPLPSLGEIHDMVEPLPRTEEWGDEFKLFTININGQQYVYNPFTGFKLMIKPGFKLARNAGEDLM